jgi:hypothetical protein
MTDQLQIDGQPPVALIAPRYVLGKGAACDIILQSRDGTVSRQHATLQREAHGAWSISDHSTNGTFVNGRRVENHLELRDGDMLTLGDCRIVLRSATDSPTVAHPQPDYGSPGNYPPPPPGNAAGLPRQGFTPSFPPLRSAPPGTTPQEQQQLYVLRLIALGTGAAMLFSFFLPLMNVSGMSLSYSDIIMDGLHQTSGANVSGGDLILFCIPIMAVLLLASIFVVFSQPQNGGSSVQGSLDMLFGKLREQARVPACLLTVGGIGLFSILFFYNQVARDTPNASQYLGTGFTLFALASLVAVGAGIWGLASQQSTAPGNWR